jgi:hypothetical protein
MIVDGASELWIGPILGTAPGTNDSGLPVLHARRKIVAGFAPVP